MKKIFLLLSLGFLVISFNGNAQDQQVIERIVTSVAWSG